MRLRHMLIAMMALVCAAPPSFAQSYPSWAGSYGYVPTSGQIKAAWQSKQDLLGAGGVTASMLASGATVANLGFTPANPAISNNFLAFQSTTLSLTGQLSSTSFGYMPLATLINIPSDNASSQTGFTPGQTLPTGFFVRHFFGGSSVNNGRDALSVECGLSAPTSASNAYRYYLCGNFYAHTSTPDNGTIGTPAGVQEGAVSQAVLNTGATNWYANIGFESNAAIETGASAKIKALILTDNWPSDQVHGSSIDSHIVSYGDAGALPLNTWADVSNWGGAPAVGTTGTLIKVYGGWTLANGLDFNGVTITGNVLQWGGSYSISGNGNAVFNSLVSAYPQISGTIGAASLPACNAGARGVSVMAVNYGTASYAGVVTTGAGSEPIHVTCTGTNWRYE